MSAGTTIRIDGDATGFVQATESSKKAARDMSNAVKGVIGESTEGSVKGLKGMDHEGRKACKRLNAGMINMSATITGVGVAVAGVAAAWGRFSGLLESGDDVARVTARLKAFTGGAASAAQAARDVVAFADTPPFGLEETQRAAQLLLGCGVRASELKSTLESLGNVAAGGGASLEQMGIRLAKAYQTGKVTMEVLEPMMNSGINVMGVLAQRTGKTQAELQKMMSTGKIGFRDLLGVLTSMGSSGGQFAGAMTENTQDLGSRMKALSGAAGALGRMFAEPVSNGVKDAIDQIGASWSAHGPEVERGLRGVGEMVGNMIRGIAPVVSVVGSGLAKIATGGGAVEKSLRGVITALALWKLAGTSAGAAVFGGVWRAAAALNTVDVRVKGLQGGFARFGNTARTAGSAAARAFKGLGGSIAGASAGLKGLMVTLAAAGAVWGASELAKAYRTAFKIETDDERTQRVNRARGNRDFNDEMEKRVKGAQSTQDVGSIMDEYDAEIKRQERMEEDLMRDDPLGMQTKAAQQRAIVLKRDREELLKLASASAKAAQQRESAARHEQQDEEARAVRLKKIKDIKDELWTLDYDRAAAERERYGNGLSLEGKRASLLDAYGGVDGVKQAIGEQMGLLNGTSAVDGVLNLDGVEDKIRSLYELLGKVEEVDREIVQRNTEWSLAEAQHRRQTEVLRAELAGEKEKLRVLQDQARVLELKKQYESAGLSKTRSGEAARETASLEKSRNVAVSGREYQQRIALLKVQADGNKNEERRLRIAERIKEIYNQQLDVGVGREEAMGRARMTAGLEDRIERRRSRKEGSGPVVDSLAQVGLGGGSMLGSMPQLTEARKQTMLLQKLVQNTSARKKGGLPVEVGLAY